MTARTALSKSNSERLRECLSWCLFCLGYKEPRDASSTLKFLRKNSLWISNFRNSPSCLFSSFEIQRETPLDSIGNSLRNSEFQTHSEKLWLAKPKSASNLKSWLESSKLERLEFEAVEFKRERNSVELNQILGQWQRRLPSIAHRWLLGRENFALTKNSYFEFLSKQLKCLV